MNHLAAYFSCATHYDAGYLCEIDAKTLSVENTTGVMKLPDPQTQETYGVRTTPCPEGHLTHEFLACDVQSSCWAHAAVTCGARDDHSAAFCGAALTPLPPVFPCNNGRGEVPYTLVCDRRPDCFDNSDETFCVFSPCDVITQFDCGKQQVRFVVHLGRLVVVVVVVAETLMSL